MGGKRKMLTKTRRATLRKELTEALVEGKFRLNDGQSLDDLLDTVDAGIRNDTYPIEITVDGLLTAWFSGPALTEPAEAQTAATGTQTQQPVAAEPVQTVIHQGNMVGDQTAEAWQAQQVAAGHGPRTPQMAQEILGAQPQHANLEAAAAAMERGLDQMAVMQAAMTPAVDPNAPVQIDISPVEDWFNLLKMAKEKKAEIEAMEELAKSNIGAYLDQEGGPDKSKVAFLNGQPVFRRNWVSKTNFRKEKLFADHPEYEGMYNEKTFHYRNELV